MVNFNNYLKNIIWFSRWIRLLATLISLQCFIELKDSVTAPRTKIEVLSTRLKGNSLFWEGYLHVLWKVPLVLQWLVSIVCSQVQETHSHLHVAAEHNKKKRRRRRKSHTNFWPNIYLALSSTNALWVVRLILTRAIMSNYHPAANFTSVEGPSYPKFTIHTTLNRNTTHDAV